MSSASSKAVGRALSGVSQHLDKTTAGASLALAVATQIGQEYRRFEKLTFAGRVWWLLTGRVSATRSRWREALVDELNDGAVLTTADDQDIETHDQRRTA